MNSVVEKLTWSTVEAAEIDPLVRELRADESCRKTPQPNLLEVNARDASDFLNDLHSPESAVPLRQFMHVLGFDECRLLALRVEHKLLQSLLLHRFCGAAVPVTRGLGRLVSEAGIKHAREILPQDRLPDVVVKSSLGYGSEVLREQDQRREQVSELIGRRAVGPATFNVIDEPLIVQERLNIAREFRVHTIEGNVIPDLTHRRYAPSTRVDERNEANAFTQSMLDCLPSGFVSGTVLGWDVVNTVEDTWRICEINFSGYHTVYGQGFQTSGYYTDTQWGFARIARLIAYVEAAYGTTVRIDASECPNNDLGKFYSWVECAVRLLRERRGVEALAFDIDQIAIPEMLGETACPPQGIVHFKSFINQLRTLLSVLE